MKIRLKFLTLPAMMACLCVFPACSSEQLPLGAELYIAPEQRSFDIQMQTDEEGRCVFNRDVYVDEPLVLSLRNAEGSPIGGHEITVYVDYAGNTFSGPPVMALYDDLNGNGVIDGESELISSAADSIARVKTDRVHGDYQLLLRINVSCPYRGLISAFSHGVYASSSVDVRQMVSAP